MIFLFYNFSQTKKPKPINPIPTNPMTKHSPKLDQAQNEKTIKKKGAKYIPLVCVCVCFLVCMRNQCGYMVQEEESKATNINFLPRELLNEIERLMFMWASFFLLFLAVINFLAPNGMIGYSTRFRNVKLEILIWHIKKRTKSCHYSLLNKIKCVFFITWTFEF